VKKFHEFMVNIRWNGYDLVGIAVGMTIAELLFR
jgi:hypothetical protein